MWRFLLSSCLRLHPDSGKDDGDYNDDDEDERGDVDEGGESPGDEEMQPAENSEDVVVDFSTSVCRVTNTEDATTASYSVQRELL